MKKDKESHSSLSHEAGEAVAWALYRGGQILFATTIQNVAQLGANDVQAGGGAVVPLYTHPPVWDDLKRMRKDVEAAISLGAAVLTRIEDPAAREIAIRNALREASKTLSTPPAAQDDLERMRKTEHPLSAPLSRSETDPAWVQVIKLFQRHGMPEPPVRLRDELVVALEWAWFAHEGCVALSRDASRDEGT